MAGYRKRNTEGPNSEDKALDLFAEMMIEKIESIQKDWHKPWFTEGVLQWPRNLSGREYNGMNALMLLLHCENEGYKIPRFCTFDCVQQEALRRGEGAIQRLSQNAGVPGVQCRPCVRNGRVINISIIRD